MRKSNHFPVVSRVIAAKNAAAARIQTPGAGIESVRIPGIDEDVGNHVVLPRTDAAEQLPVGALIIRMEYVSIGSPQIDFLDVVRICLEGNNRPARRPHRAPRLRRRRYCRRESECYQSKPFGVHIELFSQSAQALTIPECT